MDSGMEAFTLTFLNQYIPTFLIKLFFKSKMESCKLKVSNLKDFVREQIESHKASLDPKESRDLIDIFLNAGKAETGMNKFSTTISAFFPDGATTTSDAMNWIILYLAYNLDDQKRGQREIDQVLMVMFCTILLSTSEVKQGTNWIYVNFPFPPVNEDLKHRNIDMHYLCNLFKAIRNWLIPKSTHLTTNRSVKRNVLFIEIIIDIYMCFRFVVEGIHL